MNKLRTKIPVETAFGIYSLDEKLGEGGAGIVFGGRGPNDEPVAVKVLREDRATSDKRRRFKNEISFLLKRQHPNIVPVIDYGVVRGGKIEGPFYVMPRFASSLRQLMSSGVSPRDVLQLFSQVLDGVEAAHLHNVAHRDIKPENILFDATAKRLAVADFGVASITGDLAATVVETTHQQRLGNFQYCAPEQRAAGREVGRPADLYALGLLLNEMFTHEVPHGQSYKTIASVAEEFGYLDVAVAQMLSQSPGSRPSSIAELKGELARLGAEVMSAQRISAIDGTVINASEVDEPLAIDPPKLINLDWKEGKLTLFLDRPVTPAWVDVLKNHMGGHSAVWGKGPEMFHVSGNQAVIGAQAGEVQAIVDHFKVWLPRATQMLGIRLQQEADNRMRQERAALKQARTLEEQRRNILRSVKL